MNARLKTRHIIYKNKVKPTSYVPSGTLILALAPTLDKGWCKILEGKYKGWWTWTGPELWRELSALEQLAMTSE